MKNALYYKLLLFLLLPICGKAQITFFNIPGDFSIIPRNAKNNTGTFRVNGEVTYTQYKSVELRAYVKGVLKSKVSKPVYFSGSTAPFDLQLNLPAGLINYEFQIYASDGFGTYLKRIVKQVAFGDIVLITGQSNSVANAYNGYSNTGYRDSFIRSFGNSSYISGDMANDLTWHLADGDGYYAAGCVGQWGLVLAKQIIDSAKVPIGIINNGVGGTPIDYHKKNYSAPQDLNTSYGRQLYRASKCGVANEARFMMFYQGESDGSNAKLHDSLFKIMHRDWLKDYPGLQKVYVVQVRDGCGSPSLQLREVQRQFEFNLSKTRVLTVNGFNGHDGCHFGFTNGYQALGFEAAQILLTEFYGKKTKNDVYPLNPIYAYVSNANLKQITLELNQAEQTLKADANFYQLFSLENNATISISGGKIVNNKIVLDLSGPICNLNGLSYNGAPWSNPWVTNLKGVGLLSFYKLPIYASKRVATTIRVCKNQTFKLSTDSVAGYTYQWKGNYGKFVSNRANPNLKLESSEIFKLIIQDKLKICKADTQFVTVLVEEVSKPDFKTNYHLCSNDSLPINFESPGNQITWTLDDVKLSGPITAVKLAGKYVISVTSGLGCMNSDTFEITKASGLNLLDSIYLHCPGTLLQLQSKHRLSSFQWNHQVGDTNISFAYDTGLVTLLAIDSNACKYYDTAQVLHYDVLIVKIDTKPVFCDYDTLVYFKPNTSSQWFWNSQIQTSNSFRINSGDSMHLTLIDTNNCRQEFDIFPKMIQKPQQTKSEFLLCDGNEVFVQLNPQFTYQWASGTASASKIINKAGVYRFKVIDNFCEFNDSIELVNPIKPQWQIPTDTSLCTGQKVKFMIPKTLSSVSLNKMPIKDSIVAEFPQMYVISGLDSNNCRYTWNLIITEKACVNSAKNTTKHFFKINPNPTNGELTIKSNTSLKALEIIELYNSTGQRIKNYEVIRHLDEIDLNLIQISKGIYYLKLGNLGGTVMYKIVLN